MVLPVIFYILASISALAAIVVVATARSSKPLASLLALIGGFLPWIIIAIWHKLIPSSSAAMVIGCLGSAPMFMASFLHFGIGRRPAGWTIVAIASMIGACSGIGFSIFIYRLFLYGR